MSEQSELRIAVKPSARFPDGWAAESELTVGDVAITLHGSPSKVIDKSIPALDVRGANTELLAVAANPRLRTAVWNAMRARGYTDEQISFNEHAKGRHPSSCKKSETEFDCTGKSGKSNHGILDQYNAIEKTILGSGLLEPLPEGAPFIGQVITDAATLDALPEGTILRCVKSRTNPNWPDVFLHTGPKNKPWMHLDPSDRDDGEDTEYSEAILRWHGDGSAVILHLGTVR